MRYLFLLIFLTTNAFSQNYHYSVDKVTGKATLDTSAPSRPTNLVVNNITQNSATLNWTAATDNFGVVDYRVYNNNDLFLQSTGGPVTTFTLTNLKLATNYSLTIRAVDAAGNESNDSTQQIFTTLANIEQTRFIIVGASIMYNVFYYTDRMKAAVEDAYPDVNVVFYNHASVGETIDSYARGNVPNIDNTLSLYNNDDPSIKTYVLVTLGGNDRTRKGPYANLSSTEVARMNDNLDYIIDKIEAKGFTPILNELGFRNYDDSTYNNEDYGVKPYNDNIIKPKILERSPDFAFEDGQSFWQLYTLIYNDYETYLSSDNIHPSSEGYVAMRSAFVNTICKYIFTGNVPEKTAKKQSPLESKLSNNMYDEDDYLNAYLYPLAGSSLAGLQNAINTYGAVRLEAGDYGISSQMIYMGSNKRLYGVPFGTKVPNITILQGSSGVVINGLNASGSIYLESGSVISKNTIKNIHHTTLKATGANLENNTIINLTGGIDFDFSSSGYFRNNTIIRHWVHAISPQIVFKGNTTTPSYGNLQIWLNSLTPGGDGNIYDTVQDVTIVGFDSEGWNLSGKTDKAMTYMRNMGDVKITSFGGGNGYSPTKTPPFDIEAKNLYLFNSNLNNSDNKNDSKVRTNTNVFIVNGTSRYVKESGGIDFNLSRANASEYNGVALGSTITDPSLASNMKRLILGERKTPISRPKLEPIPNPAGANWATDRIGQPDQSKFIQNLIDSNKIAELPEGIYYIGSTINLKHNQGIKGAGTGKTVIVGLSDDFPLISFSDTGTNKRWFISNITLQGGHTGLLVQKSSASQMMVTGLAMHDVVFRNQTYGIHLNRFFGMDNNFFENVNFVSCNIGLFQERNPSSGTTQNDIMYLDKNVFYKMQVIDCGIGFSMIAGRANNLNSWVDCVFDGNGIAVDLHYNNYASFMNCDFKNHTGEYVIGRSSALSLYSCDFSSNTTNSIFKTTSLTMEGSSLADNVPLLVAVGHNPVAAYIQNSTVTGNLGYYTDGVISNSILKNNPDISKLLIHIVNGKVTTVLNDNPNPYPQYLVKP